MFAHEEEEFIMEGLYSYLDSHQPFTLVTFNGRDFDLPMLYMRGLLHGYDFAQVLPMDKYSKTHIDIYQHLGGRWGMNGTLAEFAWHFGLADELDGHGSSIQQQFDSGDWESIIAHCRADVEVTESLFLRMFPNGVKKRY
jgi:predicted PolB exonuclease-like 3'-5' exonuclease